MKGVHILIFSSPFFLAFGLTTERYGVSLRIQSECGKIRTYSKYGHYPHSDIVQEHKLSSEDQGKKQVKALEYLKQKNSTKDIKSVHTDSTSAEIVY